MPVWANIYLGRELLRGPKTLNILDKRRMAVEAEAMLSRLSRTMPPIDAPTSQLSGGQRQAIAIARAAAWGSKVIIMDEPTAALGPAETRAVEEVIAGLRDRGLRGADHQPQSGAGLPPGRPCLGAATRTDDRGSLAVQLLTR